MLDYRKFYKWYEYPTWGASKNDKENFNHGKYQPRFIDYFINWSENVEKPYTYHAYRRKRRRFAQMRWIAMNVR